MNLIVGLLLLTIALLLKLTWENQKMKKENKRLRDRQERINYAINQIKNGRRERERQGKKGEG